MNSPKKHVSVNGWNLSYFLSSKMVLDLYLLYSYSDLVEFYSFTWNEKFKDYIYCHMNPKVITANITQGEYLGWHNLPLNTLNGKYFLRTPYRYYALYFNWDKNQYKIRISSFAK